MANCPFDRLPGMSSLYQLFRMPSLSSAVRSGPIGVFACRLWNPTSVYPTQICSSACLKLCVIQLERFLLDKVKLRSCSNFDLEMRSYPTKKNQHHVVLSLGCYSGERNILKRGRSLLSSKWLILGFDNIHYSMLVLIRIPCYRSVLSERFIRVWT